MIPENGDLVMFRKPHLNLYRFDAREVEELYVYGMIKKYTAPYTSFNKFYDIREDKLIVLSKGRNDR